MGQSIVKNPRRIFSQLGGGGSGSTTITTVANYTSLPVANTVSGEFRWVSNSTGVYLTGLYYSNGVSWEFNPADDIIIVANYSALPVANTVTGKFYWCSASQGTSWLPGSFGGTYYSAGLYYSNGTTWEWLNVPYQATQAEVNAGINTDKFLTPSTFQNSAQLNNKEPAITGTTNLDFWSGAKTFINFASTVRSSVLTGLSLATNQVIAATDSVLAALGYLQAQITAWPSATQTLTNKTIKPRIVTVTQSATPSINIDNGTTFQITGLAQAITSMSTNMTGTPYDGQCCCFEITDNGTARAITLGSNFIASTAQGLPTTTVSSVTLQIYTKYRSAISKHEVQFVN